MALSKPGVFPGASGIALASANSNWETAHRADAHEQAAARSASARRRQRQQDGEERQPVRHGEGDEPGAMLFPTQGQQPFHDGPTPKQPTMLRGTTPR